MPLNHADLCDTRECNARAFVRVYKEGFGDLQLCGHDAARLLPKMEASGFVIIDDDRALLLVSPGASAAG